MRKLNLAVIAVGTALTLAPFFAHADTATKFFASDRTYSLGSATVTVKAGSAYTDITPEADSFTVTVPDGEAFEIRQTDNPPFVLENDATLPTCKVLQDRSNRLLITGPRTAAIRLGTSHCSTANAGTDDTSSITVANPASGETATGGSTYNMFWTTGGRAFSSIRIRLSTDGGETYPTTVVENLINNGFYAWQVPLLTTTDTARLLIEGVDQGAVVAKAVSPAFRLEGTAPIAPPVTETPTPAPAAPAYDFDPAAETAAASSVDDGVGYVAPAGGLQSGACTPGLRVKGPASPAVYYCGRDGKRHAFPNGRVYASWFPDFVGVVSVTDAQLAGMTLGQPVLYRPGVRLVKLATDPKVYAVGQGGTLRWVTTEAAASALYGTDWNKMIDDVPDTFFADYMIGEPIE
jgi:hypothetical protein